MLFVISVALVERDHAGERAFDLADVGFDAAGGMGDSNASVEEDGVISRSWRRGWTGYDCARPMPR